ncbi:MAG: 2-amino-4-hydroxy-6-hydroxymethyldihydropteridine diphosphokinase [Prevotellamassilia sp.]|nr:2-amino-4-hydroxy-6-hydroxymethyldihydropteridine diphosphokinase [Prevotellamassilia sp.]
MKLLLALGAHIGAKEEQLRTAIRALETRIGTLLKCSRFYTTAPVGFASNNAFVNAVVLIETTLSPETILDITQQIEREQGRTSKTVNGIHTDRTLDIDLLACDNHIIDMPSLQLPHPRLHQRRFVLEPLCDVMLEGIHPTLHTSYKSLLMKLNTGTITHECTATTELLDALNYLLPQLSSSAKVLTADRLQEVLNCPTTRLYTLRDEEGKIRATTTLSLQELITGTKAWVEDVVVDSEARGRGYARQLLQHLAEEAKAIGAKSLNLTSRPSREAANKLYQSEGYEIRETNVYRKAVKNG